MSPAPTSPQTALQAAASLIASGRAVEAARELNALVRAAPTYAAAYVLLAKAREASGDRVRALDAWHRAYFLVPSSPLVKRERQRLLDILAPPAETSPVAERAEPDDGPDPEAFLTQEAPALTPPEPLAAEAPAPEAASPEAPAQGGAARAPARTSGHSGPRRQRPARMDRQFPNRPQRRKAPPRPRKPTFSLPSSMARPPPLARRRSPNVDEGWSLVDEHEEAGVEATEEPVTPDVLSPDETQPDAPEAEPVDITDATELPDDTGLDHDLDALIRDLEDAPRIRPDPEFDGPDVVSNENSVDDMASETLAQIYAAQQQYAEAAIVYEKLARQRPERADEMRQRAEDMRRRSSQ